MSELKDRILALSKKTEALDPDSRERERLLGSIHQYADNFLQELPIAKAFTGGSTEASLFGIEDNPGDMREILEVFDREVAKKGVKPASEGHLGYIPGGGVYTAALGDYLAAITNEYAGIAYASPGAVAMEHSLLNWMKSLFGFPESAVGNLTSGGSIANMIALTAARDGHKIKGNAIEKSVVYMSAQLHHCNHKALRIIGLEDIIIRELDLDNNSKILAKDLTNKIEQDKASGLNPFMVIASAGTTDTGAVDPLREIGEISALHNMWFHIDAAYGGFFALTASRKHLFKGIELADSLAVDPHKGLFLPFGLGAVLVKNKEAVFHSHHYTATYMQDAIDNSSGINPADVSPELTKHFRALRLWLPLSLHGLKPFVACLEEKLLLTQYFRERLQEIGFQLGPVPDLTVSYFWWPNKSSDENEFNKQLMKEIHKDGSVFLTSTLIKNKFVIRMAILSFRTKLETVDKAVRMIQNALEVCLAEE